jgi:hypothetical protein
MIRRLGLIAAILLALAIPARAQSRIIVRTTVGPQVLQQVLALQPLCLLSPCTVIPTGLGDPSNQLFVVTTSLDAQTLLNLVLTLPGAGVIDAELDQLISLVGGMNTGSPANAPTALLDSSSLPYYGSNVWNGYANQPAAQTVGVSAAHSPPFSVTGSGVVVADIDTGVDPNHPAYARVLLPGYDFTRNQSGGSELNDFPSSHPPCTTSTCTTEGNVNQSSVAFLDQSSAAFLDGNPNYAAFGHGTMVIGIIHLVAPNAFLLPLKAFGANGTGYLSDILHAIYYAVGNGANVINMSFDFPNSSPELATALDYASPALICAASAGNDGRKADPSTGFGLVYPAALQSVVMGVGSTTASDPPTRSTFSNYGNAIVWVGAPGEGIVTTYPFSTYAAGWGTSFSAPFVSGGAALLLNKQRNTDESHAAAAMANAVSMAGQDMGNGRLDLVNALAALSPQDFTLSASPISSTINAGQSSTYTVTVTPSSGFNQTVTLGCGGFPLASTCVITPPAVTLDGTNSATATVTIQTTARSAAPLAIPLRIRPLPPVVAVGLVYLLIWLVWLFHFSAQRFGQDPCQRPGLSAALGLFAILLYSYSCGGAAAPVSTPSPSSPQSSSTPFSLTLNPASVNGGKSSTGQITLSSPAPSGGTVFSLSSSNTSVATVPASVTVAAGSIGAVFQVSTMTTANSTTVTISAANSGVTQTASLTVTPQPPPGPISFSLTLNPTSVNGGSPSTGQITLSSPAPNGGAIFSLSSSDTSVATVPASVTVAAGSIGAVFQVPTMTTANSTTVTISASNSGLTQTAPLTVTPQPPPGPISFSLTLSPTSVNGGNPSTGQITLSSPAPSGGIVFSLSSSNTSVATVPASVTVAAGSTGAAFQVSTMTTANSAGVTISAANSGVTQTAPLTVTPQPPSGPTLTSLTLNPKTLVGPTPSIGTVTLSGPAPNGGVLVSLSSSNPGVVTVPASVTISQGATSTSFTANTSIVTASNPVTITIAASYAGVTQPSQLTVMPPPPPGTPAGTYTLTITGTSGNLNHNTTVSLTVK